MNSAIRTTTHNVTGRRAAAALAFGLLALTTQAQSPAPGNPALLRAINSVREQGCGSGPAHSPALHEDPALSQVAALIADGRPLQEAIEAAGYRAVRAAQVAVSGIEGPGALTVKVLGKSCAAVMPPALLDAGFHQRGKQTWVVLAEPFSPPPADQAVDVQARVLALVNQARGEARRCGKESFAATRPLRLTTTLHRVAEAHADDMAAHNYFSHTGRDGKSVAQRATRAGYRWRAIGENIAAGQLNAEAAVQGWLDSPDHCENIMSPQYTEMALAYAVNKRSTHGIYWVQVFGGTR